jgi:AraC-like DNA-binding protein
MSKYSAVSSEFIKPMDELKSIVQYFQVFHYNERSKEAFFRVFPEGTSGLVYCFGNPHYELTTEFEHKRDHLYFKGQFDHYSHYKSVGKTNLIIVKFTPLGGYLFLQQDMRELQNLTLPLKKFYKHDYTSLMLDLKSAPEDIDKVNILQNYILEKSIMTFDSANEMKKIIDVMIETKGKISIPELAEIAEMSISSLEKKFNKYIGFNPKTFCRIQTMMDFFAKQKAEPNKNLYDLAIECGYHDQSHFIKDFKKFTGTSPKKYLRSIDLMGYKSIKE